MGFELDKKCSVDLSPNTVLPYFQQCSSIEKRNTRRKPPWKDDKLSLKEEFKEITFGCYRSSSSKSIPLQPMGLERNLELKRGSIYQSTKEVRKMNEIGNGERRKIEISLGTETSSFSVVDSLCNSEEESIKRISKSSISSARTQVEPCLSDDFFEICFDSDNSEKSRVGPLQNDSTDGFRSDSVAGPRNSGNELLERDTIQTLHKSLSSKMEMPHSPSTSESDRSTKTDSKVRFLPIRKMFDPFTRSISLRNPRKSLLQDFSNTAHGLACDSQFVKKDNHDSVVASSAVHLHGSLKLENNHGLPFFKFSLDFREDVFVAKTWTTDNDVNWVYTFHFMDGRKKRNTSSLDDIRKNSLMAGQMQVKCFLSSDLKKDGVFDNSMVTEFVLYDTARVRQSNAAEEIRKSASNSVTDISSNVCPWKSADLHPNLETAAVVMQIPLKKREGLKYKRGDRLSNKMENNDVHGSGRSERVNVVIPMGNHGLPNDESSGPSSLLDRWRLGGGCDCGGWDMACPLIVFGDRCIRCVEDRSHMGNRTAFKLFAQGSKENAPALTMTLLEKGHYAVDFHAQLSTLQAFSICVALLHGSEACNAVSEEKNNQLLQCSSLKVLIEEEVKFLIEAVTAEEKKKAATSNLKENPSLYVLNPPFSPIARV